MVKYVHIFRFIVATLLGLTLSSCSSMWINKSGQLTAIISEVEESELHDIYTLMRANGYLMKVPGVIETTEQEAWDQYPWGKDGEFKDRALPLFYVYYQYLKQEKRLRVLIVEFYNKGGGFSAEGLLRADQITNLLKQRFGDSLKVVVRSYYTGMH